MYKSSLRLVYVVLGPLDPQILSILVRHQISQRISFTIRSDEGANRDRPAALVFLWDYPLNAQRVVPRRDMRLDLPFSKRELSATGALSHLRQVVGFAVGVSGRVLELALGGRQTTCMGTW